MAKYYDWNDFDVNWEDEGFEWEEAVFSRIIANITINNSTTITAVENNGDVDINVSNYEYSSDIESITPTPPVEEIISVPVSFSSPPAIVVNISDVVFDVNDDVLPVPPTPQPPIPISITMTSLPDISVDISDVEIE